MNLSIAISNDMLGGSALFSLMKELVQQLEKLCAEVGECTIANLKLGDCVQDGRNCKQAEFDLELSNSQAIRISATARTLEDAIANTFDDCERYLRLPMLQETRA
jgi:hypothetical protein